MSVKLDEVQLRVIINGEQGKYNLKELTQASKQLNAELRNLPIGTKAFTDKASELTKVNTQIRNINEDLKGMNKAWSSIKTQLISFGATAAAFLGFQFITSQISNLIKKQGELSDQFAEIQKTTGLTAAEVENLNAALGKINTRTGTSGLRDIAIAAGQLGINKNDIVKFTEATDKLFVVMGSEFKGTATDFASELGKLRNVFSDIKSDNISDDMLHIGNALNVLAQSGVATGPVMADFANRIGGIGISLGLTTGQVLGLSATLQELNVSEERGGTAVGKILKAMTLHVQEFADVAGMSMQDFSNLVNKDLYGAFLKVVEGSQKTANSATTLSDMLDKLHIDGSGASEVFAKLSNNMKILDEKTTMATKSLGSTSSIMTQFEIQNNSVGASLDKINKKIYSAAMSIAGPFVSAYIKVANWIFKIKEAGDQMVEQLQAEQLELGKLEVKLYDVNLKGADRVKIIDQLKEKYPELLGNLNSETATNDELAIAIGKVNDQLINRIIIQRKQKEIDDQMEKIASAKETLANVEINATTALAEAATKYHYVLKDGMTLQQQAANASEFLYKQRVAEGKATIDLRNLALQLGSTSQAYAIAQEEYNKVNNVGTQLENEKKKLMEQLGVTISNTTEATKQNTAATDANAEADINSIESLKAKIKALKKAWAEAPLGSELKDQLKAQLDAAQKELDEAMGKLSKDQKQFAKEEKDERRRAREEAFHEYDDYYKQRAANQKEYERFLIDNMKDGHEKEIAEEALKFRDELAQLHKFYDDTETITDEQQKIIEQLVEHHRQRLLAIDKKYDDKATKEVHDVLDKQTQMILGELKERTDAEKQAQQKKDDMRAAEFEATQTIISGIAAIEENYMQGVMDDDKRTAQDRSRAAQHLKEMKLAEASILLAVTLLADGLSLNWPKFATDSAFGAIEIAAIAATPIPKYARGVIVDDPHVAMVGEDGPEAWIPLGAKYRDEGISLWNQVGQMLQPQINNHYVTNTTAPGGSGNEKLLMQIIGENTKVIRRLEKKLDEGVNARLNYDQFVRDLKTIDTARNKARVGN